MNRDELLAAFNEAAKDIKTIDVKGKSYVMVNERIKAFRKIWPAGVIKTTLLEDDGERVTFQAEVYDDKDNLLAMAHAFEIKSSSYINKTSYIENCETSAVGRALGFIGIGCDDSIASAEEVKNAIEAQDAIKAEEVGKKKLTAVRVKAFRSWLKENNVDEAKMLSDLKLSKLEDITEKTHENIVKHADDARERWGA